MHLPCVSLFSIDGRCRAPVAFPLPCIRLCRSSFTTDPPVGCRAVRMDRDCHHRTSIVLRQTILVSCAQLLRQTIEILRLLDSRDDTNRRVAAYTAVNRRPHPDRSDHTHRHPWICQCTLRRRTADGTTESVCFQFASHAPPAPSGPRAALLLAHPPCPAALSEPRIPFR